MERYSFKNYLFGKNFWFIKCGFIEIYLETREANIRNVILVCNVKGIIGVLFDEGMILLKIEGKDWIRSFNPRLRWIYTLIIF